MSLMIVAVAFASLSAVQGDSASNPAELTSANREGPQGANNTEGVEANGERRICRRMTVSGTHRYRRVCLTAEQWRQQAD